MDLLTIQLSETTLYIIKLVFGGIGCTILGVILNNWYANHKNRLQIMKCFYLEDEILSKIPVRNDDNTVHENIHCKKFKITNTTNKDISEFKVFFQFDATAEILDCYSQSKEGYNRQRIRPNHNNKNEAEALVKNFNRSDAIVYVFRIANISANDYYITECNCIGFKIKCKDKRNLFSKSKSKKSDQLLVVRH